MNGVTLVGSLFHIFLSLLNLKFNVSENSILSIKFHDVRSVLLDISVQSNCLIIHNIGIFVQLLMGINWMYLPGGINVSVNLHLSLCFE